MRTHRPPQTEHTNYQINQAGWVKHPDDEPPCAQEIQSRVRQNKIANLSRHELLRLRRR